MMLAIRFPRRLRPISRSGQAHAWRGSRLCKLGAAVAAGLLPLTVQAASPPARTLHSEDIYRFLTVESPSCSADGQAIAYTVTRSDRRADERISSIWLVARTGGAPIRLTPPEERASTPRLSPDGHRLAYLSSRSADDSPRLHLLDRRTGTRSVLAAGLGDIDDIQWSPDGRRLVLVAQAGAGAAAAKVAPPILIDRLHFKQDVKGYVGQEERSHLFVLDLSTRKLVQLTSDPRYAESSPAWSPDARQLAFVSTRKSDPDRSGSSELYVMDAHAGADARLVGEFGTPNRQSVFWTLDGQELGYTLGRDARLSSYQQDRLALVPVQGGAPRILAETLDRALFAPAVGADGEIAVLVDDDLNQYPAILRGGTLISTLAGPRTVSDQCVGGGKVNVVASTDDSAPEIYALETGRLRKLSGHNDAALAGLRLGAVRDIAFASADGTQVHGLMTLPPDYREGERYPTLLWIHGGPNMQDTHGLIVDTYPLALERQWFAAHGYVVLAINYRGSSGRGQDWASAIAADWGNKEVADLLAAVDFAVREKIADPARLGIGGWSYGGILTDYTIASDGRFRAAISGAGSAEQIGMYGSDQYILQYNAELGPPWKSPELWMHLSYPFFHADRIHTPTLFVGGEKDFNVPIAGGEQMYQALRTLEVPTQLAVYPGQFHLFTRPSYIQDRLERYLSWFDRYLKAAAPEPAPTPATTGAR